MNITRVIAKIYARITTKTLSPLFNKYSFQRYLKALVQQTTTYHLGA